MRYPIVLFDADGTLFDFERTAAAALERTFDEYGLAYRPDHILTYRAIDERLWQALERGEITRARLLVKRFEEFLAAIGATADPKAFGDRYMGHVAHGTHLIEGAPEVIESLAGHARLALITNGFSTVQRSRFAQAPIADAFETIVISEEIGAAKPDPAIFDETFRRMGNPHKADVLIVGDSLSSDIAGGIAYGIDTCWFNPTGEPVPADLEIAHEIRALHDVPSIVLG